MLRQRVVTAVVLLLLFLAALFLLPAPAWSVLAVVMVMQGAVFIICVLTFRRGIVGEIAHYFKRSL